MNIREQQNTFLPGTPSFRKDVEEIIRQSEESLEIALVSSIPEYTAGIPVTIDVSVLNGTPPFLICWELVEAVSGEERKLEDFWASENYAGSKGIYITDSPESAFTFVPPILGNDLFVCVGIVDREMQLAGIGYITVVASSSGNDSGSRDIQPLPGFPMQRYYEEVRLDRTVYTGSWQETYAAVLKKNENPIRNHQAVYDKWSSSDEGEDLRILFLDLNGDGIPEMLFLKAEMFWGDDPSDEDDTDLYIYSNDGTQTACVVSIQGAYTLGGNGPEYSLFTDAAHPGMLYIDYFGGNGMWQVGYDPADGFRKISECLSMMESQPEGISNYYLNGNPVSKSDWDLYYISPDSDSVTLIASSWYSGAVYHGLDYDSAMEYLKSQGDEAAD